MNKFFLFLVVFIFSLPTYAISWQPQNDGLEVDFDSIVKGRTSITAWVKDYNYGQYERRNLRKVSYVLYHSTAFCNEGRLTNLAVAYYDRKGRLIDIEQQENIHYLDVQPSTIQQKITNALCVY